MGKNKAQQVNEIMAELRLLSREFYDRLQEVQRKHKTKVSMSVDKNNQCSFTVNYDAIGKMEADSIPTKLMNKKALSDIDETKYSPLK